MLFEVNSFIASSFIKYKEEVVRYDFGSYTDLARAEYAFENEHFYDSPFVNASKRQAKRSYKTCFFISAAEEYFVGAFFTAADYVSADEKNTHCAKFPHIIHDAIGRSPLSGGTQFRQDARVLHGCKIHINSYTGRCGFPA